MIAIGSAPSREPSIWKTNLANAFALKIVRKTSAAAATLIGRLLIVCST
jgi:hypothetical protein